MRILLITSTLRPESGWGTFSLNTATELQRRGHDVHLLLHESQDIPIPQTDTLPHTHVLLRSPLAFWNARNTIKRTIKTLQPDLIHVLVEPYALPLSLIRTRIPWIMNFHGTYTVLLYTFRHLRWLMCRAVRKCCGILVCSKYTRKQAIEAYGTYCTCPSSLIEQKMQLFRLGIADSKQPPSTHNTSMILHVGEIKNRKGVLDLIKGFHHYRERTQHSDVNLELIGSATEGSAFIVSLENYIQENNLQSCVRIRGRVTDAELAEAYSQASVLALLSKREGVHFEGFGLVFIEANQRGIPVIGSINSGCEEAIDDGRSGYAVDPLNPDDIAEKLTWILDENRIDPKNCRSWADAHNIAQQVDKFEEFYQTFSAQQED